MRPKIIFFIWLMIVTTSFAAQENHKLKGVLVDMNIRKKFFTISIYRENTTFSVNKDTVFQQKDRNVYFSDILPGDIVEVTYQSRGRRKVAQWVQVEPSNWRKKSYKSGYVY